jgi:predicted Zn-dependent protease
VVALKYGDQIYRFTGYSLKANFDAFSTALAVPSSSFAALTDPAALNIQPTRLKVFTTPRQGKFSSFLPNPMPVNLTADEIAIMNQVNLDDVIPAGVKIKIPN